MKPKDIAKLFNLSKQRVNYLIHSSLRKRKKKKQANKKRNAHHSQVGER